MRQRGIEDAVSSEAWLLHTLDEILPRVRTLLDVTGCAFQAVDWRRGVIRLAAAGLPTRRRARRSTPS
jgi:hypothetical protein